MVRFFLLKELIMKKILLLILLLFNMLGYSQEETIEIVEIEEEVEETSERYIPFAIIDEVPVHPNCEGVTVKSEIKKCFNLMMQKHIRKHFNTGVIDCLEKKTIVNEKTGKKEEQCISVLSSGKKRIYARFKIVKTGLVEDINVRAPHPELKKEAVRIIKLLPKMIPGKRSGIPVNVGYTLPITFNLE